MYTRLFNEFLNSDDTLRVYKDDKLIYASNKDRLLPLLEYLDESPQYHQVVIFDKLMGNAAALLAIKAGGCQVFSPLGSQLAVKTLEQYGITYHINEIVPCIQRPDGTDMCPMEKLSLDMKPEEFYEALKNITE